MDDGIFFSENFNLKFIKIGILSDFIEFQIIFEWFWFKNQLFYGLFITISHIIYMPSFEKIF
jgi:hypothetical protein